MSVVKSSFVWQFTGGFLLGAVGLLAIQPAQARHDLIHHWASHSQQQTAARH